jgi:hypothetical protein
MFGPANPRISAFGIRFCGKPLNPDPPVKRILYNIFFLRYKKMSDWHSNAKSVLVTAACLGCG